MKSATQPVISLIDDQPEIQQRPPDIGVVHNIRESLRYLGFSEQKTPEEIREILLRDIYDYMQRNFCLSENELPRDEILNIVKVYQTGIAEDYYLRSHEGLSPAIIGKIVAASKDGRIPLIALNSIFLKSKTGKDLLQISIKNYITSKHWSPLSKSELNSVTEDLFVQLSDSYEIERSLEERLFANLTINAHNTEFRHSVEKPKIKDIVTNRKTALKEMNKIISWPYEPNDLALNDEIMKQFFDRKDGKATTTPFENEFLTTYFDSAQFGLGNRLLSEAADELASGRDIQFTNFIQYVRRRISEYALGHPYDNSLYVTENGTEAAQLLFNKWTKEGDRVLAVNQEYEPILQWLEKEKGIDVIRLKKTMKDPDYKDYIKQQLIFSGANIVLISDLSRFGTVFPFHLFKDLLSSENRGFRLIVDACQSIGRKILNFYDIPVNASIISCQKASEVGEPAGLVATQPHLAKDLFSSLKDTDYKGSANLPRLARVGIACCPDLLGRLPEQRGIKGDDLKKMTASIQDRDKAIKDLSAKFLYMIDWINRKNGGRIEIINPYIHHYDDGSVDTTQLGGIFELTIHGVEYETVELLADSYGIAINKYSDASEPGYSFRVAFHPFMNDEAIKILGYVLDICSDPKKLNEHLKHLKR